MREEGNGGDPIFPREPRGKLNPAIVAALAGFLLGFGIEFLMDMNHEKQTTERIVVACNAYWKDKVTELMQVVQENCQCR